MVSSIVKTISEEIANSKKILITSHSRPTTDTIVSLSVLSNLLTTTFDKQVELILSYDLTQRQLSIFEYLGITKDSIKNELPQKYYTISIKKVGQGIESVTYNEEDDKFNFVITPQDGLLDLENVSINENGANYDLIIVVDTPSLNFLGDLYKNNYSLFNNSTIISFDSHKSNAKYGKYNLTYTDIDTTSQVIFSFIKELEIDLNEKQLNILFAGINSSINLSLKDRIRPSVYHDMGELIRLGAKVSEANKILFSPNNANDIYLIGDILNSSNVGTSNKLSKKIVECKVSLNKEEVQTVDTDKVAEVVFWNVNIKDIDIAYIVIQKSSTESVVYIYTYNSDTDLVPFAKELNGKGDKYFIKTVFEQDMHTTMDSLNEIFDISLSSDNPEDPFVSNPNPMALPNVPDFSPTFNTAPLVKESPISENNTIEDKVEDDEKVSLFDPRLGQ